MKLKNLLPKQMRESKPSAWWLLVVVAIAVVGLIITATTRDAPEVEAGSMPDMVEAIEAGEVESLTLRGNVLVAAKFDGTYLRASKESNISTVEALQIMGVSPETLKTLPIVVADASPGMSILLPAMIFLIPTLLFGVFFLRAAQKGEGQGGLFKPGNQIGRSNPRVISGAEKRKVASGSPRVRFSDVAGSDQAKLELQEVVEFLKRPERFTRLGARIPKGVLMAGAPGTGKTLIAKAVAGEAGVPFYSISGSEFVEMYVGVGASRVRHLFKRAKEHPPAVIFVDEIDAVGRRRGAGYGSGSDEREQTLNQILVEMDGFDTATNVIVIAATNRPDVLDPALLRPGRFDRKVVLDQPDVQSREAILRIHARGKPLAEDVSLADLAKLTPGFVGADLESLVNEAAILAGRRHLDEVSMAEFQDAMERIVAGPERQGQIISEQERKVVAYHEAGHAVVMHNLAHSDPVHKVSIVSRGMALGYTMPLPENGKHLRTKETFEDEIVALLGGRAAEELIFNSVTTGAANDLERATGIARAMVTRLGFSEALGLRTFGQEQGNPFLGNMGELRDYSEEMAQRIDEEIRQILDVAYQQATEIVIENRDKLEALAEKLLDVETVNRTEFVALMG
jgi:cell division protease FtsH